MKIILLKDVKNFGNINDIIEVNDNYAKNFLIKKNFAIEATKASINDVKLRLKKQKEIEDKLRKEANDIANILTSKDIKIKMKLGASGKLYGSITSNDISKYIKEVFNLNIDKKKVILNNPIKEEGKHLIKIKLYKDISCNISIVIEGTKLNE